MADRNRVPALGESVTEATVGTMDQEGRRRGEGDETLVELETDKVTLEVAAPAAGVHCRDPRQGRRHGRASARCWARSPKARARAAAEPAPGCSRHLRPQARRQMQPRPRKAAAEQPAADSLKRCCPTRLRPSRAKPLPAAARRCRPRCVSAGRERLDPGSIAGTGKDGRITKGDVLAALETPRAASAGARSRAGAGAVAPAAPQTRRARSACA